MNRPRYIHVTPRHNGRWLVTIKNDDGTLHEREVHAVEAMRMIGDRLLERPALVRDQAADLSL